MLNFQILRFMAMHGFEVQNNSITFLVLAPRLARLEQYGDINE